MTQITQIVLCVGILLACFIIIYKMGKQDGEHNERTRLIDIIHDINKVGMFQDQRAGVALVVTHVVNKLREE